MANYVAVADVQALLPETLQLSDESFPTQAQVTVWCGDISSILNVEFGAAGVTLPISDTDQLANLKRYSAKKLVYDILSLRTTNRDPKLKPYWETFNDEWDALIKFIRDGMWPKPSGSSGLPSSRTMDAEGDTETPGIQPVFTTTMEP